MTELSAIKSTNILGTEYILNKVDVANEDAGEVLKLSMPDQWQIEGGNIMIFSKREC